MHTGKAALRQVSLYSLCRFFLVEAATRSLFGGYLHDINSEVVENMLEFNDDAWMTVFRYPGFLEIPITKPQRNMMATLTKFIQLPQHSRGKAAWAIKNMLAAFEIVGIDLDSRASMMLMGLWAYVHCSKLPFSVQR
jgi:hypothetical protein